MFDNKLINKAYEFALDKHKGQKYGKEDFIYHPLQVYEIITRVCPTDINLRVASICHDLIEDAGVTKDDLEEKFNQDVAELVWEVTKFKPEKNQPATFPNLKSKRAIILKFADRLANLSNMQDWPDKRQQWYLKSSKFWFS